MQIGIIQFPGSSSEHDVACAWQLLGLNPKMVWHDETNLQGYDLIVLPGGFSYGDYLRPGGLAKFAPVMNALKEYAERGGLVLGIGNGFQILTESNLLPGNFLPNLDLRFRCHNQYLTVEQINTPFTHLYNAKETIQIPINHKHGFYYIDENGRQDLIDHGQVVFRYATGHGGHTSSGNPNGSVYDIAGITNKRGNILGMMPRPERAMQEIHGGIDGKRLFLGLSEAWKGSDNHGA